MKFITLLFISTTLFAWRPAIAQNANPKFQSTDELVEHWQTVVGERLKDALKSPRTAQELKVKITQVDLATRLNVGQARISKIINGLQPISLAQGLAAAAYLRVDPNWLLYVEIIRSEFTTEDLASIRLPNGRDFFHEIAQFALGVLSVEHTNPTAETKLQECSAMLSSHLTEELVNEIQRRGWIVQLSRPK